MTQAKPVTLLLYSFAALLCIANAQVKYEKCLPIKDNIDFGLAMHGYDPFKADALTLAGNPGIMDGEIFDYDCSFGKGYSNFISFRSDLNCEASMKTEAYSNVREYSRAMSESGAFGFSVEASAQYASSRNAENSEAVKALSSGKGEVFVTKATCFTHDVSIDTFSRIKFSQNFIKSLIKLNYTIGFHEDDQMTVFKPFIQTFGTHFVKRAELGATLTYQKIFRAKSGSEASQRTKKECMDESAGGCVGASYEGAVAKASAKACVNKAMNTCQENKGSDKKEIENSISSFSIVSRGSRPQALDKWLDSSFKPIPIKIHSVPIIHLLTEENLSKSDEYGFPDTLYTEGLRLLFLNGYKKYCQEVLGLTQAQCQKDLTGCAQVGDCKYNQDCVNDPAQPKGFRCSDKPVPSDTYCTGQFVIGTPTGSTKVKYSGVTFGQCIQQCTDEGGLYVTVGANADTTNFQGDCWCEKGSMRYIDLKQVGNKTVPVGLCNKCHGVFQVGDANSAQQEKAGDKITVANCAEYCSMRSATYMVINNYGSSIDAYNDFCFCLYGPVTEVSNDPGGLHRLARAAPVLQHCKK